MLISVQQFSSQYTECTSETAVCFNNRARFLCYQPLPVTLDYWHNHWRADHITNVYRTIFSYFLATGLIVCGSLIIHFLPNLLNKFKNICEYNIHVRKLSCEKTATSLVQSGAIGCSYLSETAKASIFGCVSHHRGMMYVRESSLQKVNNIPGAHCHYHCDT